MWMNNYPPIDSGIIAHINIDGTHRTVFNMWSNTMNLCESQKNENNLQNSKYLDDIIHRVHCWQ